MIFHTQLNPAKVKPTISGSKEIDDYEPRLTKNGSRKLVKKTTKKNIYDRIQANKEESEVYNIINKFTSDQRKEIITMKASTTSEVYDLTQMPENLIQAKQMQLDAENKWRELPLNLRKEFNHDPNQFMAAMQDGTFRERYEKVYPKKVQQQESTNQTTTTTKQEEI